MTTNAAGTTIIIIIMTANASTPTPDKPGKRHLSLVVTGADTQALQMTTSLRVDDIFVESLHQGKLAGNFFRALRAQPAAFYHMPCTWNVPAIYLAGTVQVSALIYLAGDGGRAGLRGCRTRR